MEHSHAGKGSEMKSFSYLVLAMVAALAVGCGEGSGDGATVEDAADAGASNANGASATTETRPADEQALPGGIKTDVEMTRETAAGTLATWLDHCSRAEWEHAMAITDPNSDGFDDLSQMVNTWSQAAGNTRQGADQMRRYLHLLFTTPFVNCTFEEVYPQEDRVRFAVTLRNREPMPVDVAKVDGEWWVLPPTGLIAPDQETSQRAVDGDPSN